MTGTKIKNFFKMLRIFRFSSAVTFYKLKYLKGDDKKTYYLGLKNGLKLSVNKNAGDLTTLFEIFVNDDYLFKGDHKGNYNILDIGANVGYFSLYAIKEFPVSQIHSFEPFPDTFNRLSENIINNNSINIRKYPYAVSNYNGTADFYSFDWAGCNTLIDREFDKGHYNKTTVECIAFDDIFDKTGVNSFEFGKIDCEGSEYQIFMHSKDENIKKIKNYIIEVHEVKNYTKDQLIKRFKDLGYEVLDKGSLIEANYRE